MLRILISTIQFFNIAFTFRTYSFLERQKVSILERLEINDRPSYIEDPIMVPFEVSQENYNYIGNLEKIVVHPYKNSPHCITPETSVENCYQYSFKYSNEIVSSLLNLKSTPFESTENLTISVFEVDEYFGELQLLDELELGNLKNQSISVQFDMTTVSKVWYQKNQKEKMIKIDIRESGSSVSINTTLATEPFFEFKVLSHNQNEKCVGCCVQPFYVNFTEIGWNDWILSPPGFYANYCTDLCPIEQLDETSKIFDNVQRNSISPSNPTKKCAPNYYGDVDFVVAFGPRDIRKTKVHGIRALSCACK